MPKRLSTLTCIRRYFEKNQRACWADNVVKLNSDLASIMGFSPREMIFGEERKHKGKVAVDPNRGFNNLYVYCVAAEAIPVGDIKAPLLSVIDAAGNFGDNSQIVYDASVRSSLKERV